MYNSIADIQEKVVQQAGRDPDLQNWLQTQMCEE